MNEKDYLVALNNLYNRSKDEETLEKSYELLVNLILENSNENYLKFDELECNMWVWVKKLKGYFKINSIVDLTEENNKRYIDFGFGYIEFKDNMFYRKEVKE